MKKKYLYMLLIFFIASSILFLSTTLMYKNDLDSIRLYSFKGKNDLISIDNGLIILSPGKHEVIGGTINYFGEPVDDIDLYTLEIYTFKDGFEDGIVSTSLSSSEKISFPSELELNNMLGGVVSSKLFTEEDLNSIMDNLHFSLEYFTSDGEKHIIDLRLNVEEYYMNQPFKPM